MHARHVQARRGVGEDDESQVLALGIVEPVPSDLDLDRASAPVGSVPAVLDRFTDQKLEWIDVWGSERVAHAGARDPPRRSVRFGDELEWLHAGSARRPIT